MGKYVTFKVMILVDEESEIYRRLKELTALRNNDIGDSTIEGAVDAAVQTGIYGHIERNLDLYERIYKGLPLTAPSVAKTEPLCGNCGYYDPSDGKCYYNVEQSDYFGDDCEERPEPLYVQLEDDGCEKWAKGDKQG